MRAGERDFGGKIRERGGEDKKRVKRERERERDKKKKKEIELKGI